MSIVRIRAGTMLASLAVLASACGAGTVDSTTLIQSPDTTVQPIDSSDSPSTTTRQSDPSSDPSELGIIVRPGTDGELPSGLLVGCPGGPRFPVSALDDPRPLAGSGLEEIEAAARSFLDNEEGQHWPQQGWQILHETEATVLLAHLTQSARPEDEDQVAFMNVDRVNGSWRWAGASSGGSGPCPLRTAIPEGLNTVNWRLDPAAEPLTSSSTRIELLLTERECVSGQPIGDRLLGPEVVSTQEAVLIAFAAKPPPGEYQTCQGNPEQTHVVELSEPLGDREIQDGLALPGTLADFLG